ncbi:uncharacterized protein LOC142597805, partial [Dermatophagoides farinae]|uniref:uncharacterized protein LOC142597805 n=1 Tax=Dermatophagoides farinae TaxID=6954 RepID=UPI003F647EF3
MSKRDKITSDLCDSTMMIYDGLNNVEKQQQRKSYRVTDSRTATIHTRKKPGFSQVLMTTQNKNGHWRKQQQQPSESEPDRIGSEMDPFTFGTNFNTDFNTRYSNDDRTDCVQFPPSSNDPKDSGINHQDADEQQQQQQQQTSSKPIPRITRNLPYRVLYRIRPSTLHNNNGGNNNRR